MEKKYISNSTESPRMFSNDLMESLSKVHFSVPLFIYIPVIGYFSFKAFESKIGIPLFVLYFITGLIVWTITEYILHRFVFHFEPGSQWGKRVHFIFHGVHHDYPKDAKRLVMPLSASIPLATGFYFLFSIFFRHAVYLYAFFPGFIAGYLAYDMLHYAVHHYNFRNPLLKKIKHHHMLHHYADAGKGYGVSSAFWDFIFRSGFSKTPEK